MRFWLKAMAMAAVFFAAAYALTVCDRWRALERFADDPIEPTTQGFQQAYQRLQQLTDRVDVAPPATKPAEEKEKEPR